MKVGSGLVVGFGKGLVRLRAPGRARLEQAGSLLVSVGGAELNVLADLVELGWRGRWVSRRPRGAAEDPPLTR